MILLIFEGIDVMVLNKTIKHIAFYSFDEMLCALFFKLITLPVGLVY